MNSKFEFRFRVFKVLVVATIVCIPCLLQAQEQSEQKRRKSFANKLGLVGSMYMRLIEDDPSLLKEQYRKEKKKNPKFLGVLEMAIVRRYRNIARDLLENDWVDVSNSQNIYALHVMIRFGETSYIETVIKKMKAKKCLVKALNKRGAGGYESDGWTPIELLYYHEEEINAKKSYEEKINAKKVNLSSDKVLALFKKHLSEKDFKTKHRSRRSIRLIHKLFSAVRENDLNKLKEVLNVDGVDPDLYEPRGMTALYTAAAARRLDMYPFLLGKGANMFSVTRRTHGRTIDSLTPLSTILGLKETRRNPEAIQMLHDYGLLLKDKVYYIQKYMTVKELLSAQPNSKILLKIFED